MGRSRIFSVLPGLNVSLCVKTLELGSSLVALFRCCREERKAPLAAIHHQSPHLLTPPLADLHLHPLTAFISKEAIETLTIPSSLC